MFQRVETTNFRKEDVQNIRLKLTASKCSENWAFAPKRKGKYSNHPFSRSNLLLVLGRVTFLAEKTRQPD